jgi:lactose/L-arabinose transport system substrate-binding protein
MQSGGTWYFDKDGKISVEGNAPLKAALETEAKIINAGISKRATGWANWVATFTSGDVASVVSGVWLVGTIKAQKDQAGKWAVAPIPLLPTKGAIQASNLGGSSWFVMSSSKEKDTAVDFLNETYGKDIDFYQKILQANGAVGSLMAARKGEGYTAADPFFGGDKIWQKFSDWLAKIPSVNYGMYTNEADFAIVTQTLPVAKGKSADEALKATAQQLQSQIQ